MIGRTISHYRVIEKLGEGGMGIVYKAEDIRLERTVALKFLAPHLVSDEEVKERFEREAKAAAALDHPNICTVHEIDTCEGKTFIVMAFIEGEPLDETIARGPLKLKEALDIGGQVANGLEAAHKQGVVHRDVKPQNVIVGPDGRATVMDFGLAQLADRSRITKAHTTLGTVSYMSPEQAQGMNVDRRADYWALGCVLYEMVTGQRPFLGDFDQAILYSVLNEAPEPPTSLRTGVPMELEAVVDKCLQKERDSRYQSASEIAVDLGNLAKKLDSGFTRTVPAATAVSIPTPDSPRPQRVAWVVAAAATLAAVAFAALYFTKPAEQILRSWRVSPLTAYQGQELRPALSEDGERVAFVWQRGPRETGDLYVRLVEGGTPLQLTDSAENEVWPAWSPDGSRIAFARGDSIFEVSSLGGSERRLATLDAPVYQGLDWSPDGRWIAVSTQNGLRLLEVGPSRIVRVSEPSSPEWYPKFSPDGSSLAFAHGSSQFLQALYILPLDGDGEPAGEASAITDTVWWIQGGLDWFPDGERLVISAALGSRYALWEVPRDSSDVPQLLPIETDDAIGITVSSDSRRLVYARRSSVSDILRVPLDERATVVGPTKAVIASTRTDHSVLYSPDGSRLIYVSHQTGYPEIWRSDADGTNQIQLTKMEASLVGSPAWSPDGEQIAFDAYFEGHSDIYVIRSEGGDPVRITTDTSNETRPWYSGDSSRLYFPSDRTGRGEIWGMPVAGGPATQLTQTGGGVPRESPDGRFLYYIRSGGIFRVPVGGGEEVTILPNGLVIRGAWSVGPRRLYYGVNATVSGPAKILALDLIEGGTTEVLTLPDSQPRFTPARSVSISPDEGSLLYVAADHVEADLILVDDFQ